MKPFLLSPLLAYLLIATTCLATDNWEIDYLLTFVEESGCTFIRNGKEYPSRQAKDHLAYKYNHVKSRIKTADDFIEKIASKSSISRKPYEVRCDTELLKAGDWLNGALQMHRKERAN